MPCQTRILDGHAAVPLLAPCTQNIFEAVASKKSQLFLATQVCKMILKIDDVIKPSDVQ